ncbi:MAG: hypothetical protein QW134_07985, partial [Nitrososphaeria archaeon]
MKKIIQNNKLKTKITKFLRQNKKNILKGMLVLIFILLIIIIIKIIITRELNKIKLEINKEILLQQSSNNSTAIIDSTELSPQLIEQLDKEGITRYFLSEVEVINNHYVPKVYLCLFNNGQPLYSKYIYETWAQMNYPNNYQPKITLLKFRVLPKDNEKFHIDSSCFIK